MNKRRINILTFSLIGAAAYVLTDIIHEVIGHGGTCLILGDKIKLLTSVYFRSEPGSVITDLGGPASNLLIGLLLFYFLKQRKSLSVLPKLLLSLTMSYCLYWFSGTILQSSFSETGDWTYAVKQLNIGILGKMLLVTIGIIAYYFSIRLNKIQLTEIDLSVINFPLRQFIYYSYFTAAAAAVITGLLYMPDRISAAREGLLEMVASLPIILISPIEKTKIETYEIKSNTLIFNIIAITLFTLFCITLGRGFIV